jgi:ABC-2 type transport system ATP-binding protein
MSLAVECRNVTKRYRDVEAVKGVSFTMEDGKIYGVLGRNGAGKTTLMHLLTGQLLPDEGEIRIGGVFPFENRDCLNRICFIKESQRYVKHLTVSQTLDLAKAVFPNWDQRFAERLVQDFGLPMRRKIKHLSRGMESAVGIVIGLASRAPITLFDEPYLGLDAVGRNLFYERLLEDYTEHPRTVILSTHLIDEVSKLFEQVLIIHQGQLLLNEEAERLRESAFTVSGNSEAVERFVVGKRVLHTETIGSNRIAAVYGSCTEEERRQAAAAGMEVGPLPLQKLFIYLTEKGADAQWEVKSRR